MRKRTDFQTPEDRKASPNQTKGLIAKGQKPGESVQEECVLDNLSHRTPQKLLNRPHRSIPRLSFIRFNPFPPLAPPVLGRLGRRPPQAAAASNFFVNRCRFQKAGPIASTRLFRSPFTLFYRLSAEPSQTSEMPVSFMHDSQKEILRAPGFPRNAG